MNHFLITIDVEDWFQVENLRPWNPVSTWDSRELRVERNTHALLDLFDDVQHEGQGSKLDAKNSVSTRNGHCASCSIDANATNALGLPASSRKPPAPKKVQGTFFVLGWLAERLPHLVREIAARGHEVASHGNSHRVCSPLDDADLRDDLSGSKRLLEDITGTEVAGFRAPNFSVDDRVLAIIRECGYEYDSSYNSFALHGRYGKISLNGDRMGIAHRVAADFFELPVSNLPLSYLPTLGTLAHFRHSYLPWSGGAYFRLMPLGVFQGGVRSILNKDGAYLFYMHPWEIDPGQPRVEQASLASRFKHYTNIEKTEDKLRKMIESFAGCRFVSCLEYIKNACTLHRESFFNSTNPT